MLEQIQSLVGDQAAQGVQLVVESAGEQKSGGVVSMLIGVATMLFSASGIFAQLQGMLNRMWNVRVRSSQAGYVSWLRQRLLSLGMLFSILFLLLASLVVSAAIAAVLSRGAEAWTLLDLGLSWLIYVMLFALIFKFLPDADIEWRDVWVGAAATALLFAVGKYAIGLYLGNSALASSYGAAGALVVLLAWVYYSSLIVFFGAELTQVYARHYGAGIRPAEHAEAIAPDLGRAPAAS
jgi:membrane protein